MEELVSVLKVGHSKEVGFKLEQFNAKFGHLYTINETLSKKKQLLDCLFRIVRDPNHVKNHSNCLFTMRIFTRDKIHLNELFTADRIETLLHMANLVGEEEAFLTEKSEVFDVKVVVEAQKCLCNLIFNSITTQKLCANNSCIEGIMLRLRMHPDPLLPNEVKYFDMRMLFIISALCAEVRPRIRDEYHGLIYLMESIDLILKNNADYLSEKVPNISKRRSKGSRRGKKVPGNGSFGNDDDCLVAYCLDDWEVDLAIEVLKVLYNLTVNIDKNNLDEIEEAHYLRLVSHLHDLLLCDTKNRERKEDLQSHTVDLLTSMPLCSFEELLSPVNEFGKPENPEHEFHEMNVEVIAVLLEFLEKRLDNKSPNIKERLAPILICLSEAARGNSIIRKYLRYKILPPLKDVFKRPEEGTTLRNKLVTLMTSSSVEVKELAADLLFVLCKENVERLIKYTGYGNAAGLLANRGLMLGGSVQQTSTQYSSDSEESDTEEYIKYRDKINPVTGRLEEEHPHPIKEMSEEEKEVEAIKLVNMMDKLTRTGVVQPCCIGSDGKPHPIGNVLEFREKIMESKFNKNDND